MPAADYRALIRRLYHSSSVDSTELFQAILLAADEIGLDQALACLEQCVCEKRLAWLDARRAAWLRTGDPVRDAYRLFYETYLRISTPEDGAIVEETERRMVLRWWNPCPTLAACVKLGLDTRQVCRKAYHRPVQEFFSHIHPNLRFDRNYEALRPYRPYCEEIITFLEAAGTELVPVRRELALQAAHIKAEHPLANADPFAAALAMARRATLVTGAPEFEPLQASLPIRWIRES